MRDIAFFIESDDHMLEMSEDILLFDNNLTSSGLIVSFELIADIGTDDCVSSIVKAFQHENLSILDIFQTVSCNQGNPISILFGIRHDAFDCFAVVGSHSVSIGWCSCQFFKGFLR